MADFTIMSGTFTVRVNDGHSSRTYFVIAPSPQAAIAEARKRWAARHGEAMLGTEGEELQEVVTSDNADPASEPEAQS